MKEKNEEFAKTVRKWDSITAFIGDVHARFGVHVVKVEGSLARSPDIFAFTLSTCMWCTLGKRWLGEKGFAYRYLDVDTIPVEGKNHLKAELRELTGEHVRFPFLVLAAANKWHSGYDPSAWEEVLGG
jgi:glutaredoxin